MRRLPVRSLPIRLLVVPSLMALALAGCAQTPRPALEPWTKDAAFPDW